MGGRHAQETRAKKLEVILVSVWDNLRQEPVRVWIYGVLTAVVTLLVTTGVVTGTLAPLIMGVVLAALALPSPVKGMSNMISSPAPKAEEEPPPTAIESDAPIERG